ncbi:MAG: putative LPS assembly protein LptD [Lentimicrobium sp.]|nr:putative LPS assembly protein LptD [Lentimicrobium sp.]
MKYTGTEKRQVFVFIFLLALNLFFSCAVAPVNAYAQEVDTLRISPDSLRIGADTIAVFDKAVQDTSKSAQPKSKKKSSAIKTKVEYSATDSIVLDLGNQKVFMYREADIKYDKIQQKAAYIEINFGTNMLKARSLLDSVGKPYGKPEFIEGDQTFTSEEIDYNFESTKGLIKNVITKEGEGYLHGEVVKKLKDNVSNMRHGAYTTCNLEHPHYSIQFTKAKVIPGDKIITGPAFLTIEDVPLPLVLPFGLFPNKRGQSSGILVPTYGESATRGFYLENGGYYFGLNEYMELKLLGDVYSRGSWALKPTFNYRKRYKFSGSFNFSYAINTEGVRETSSFAKNRNFRVAWTHSQDPKARPKSRFNANVNFVSSEYNTYNPTTAQDMISNTFQSSISYQTSFFKDKFNFSGALSHSQNTSTGLVKLSLPNISLSATRFYPLRKKGKTTNLKWYDNVSMNYTMNATNDVSVQDSLLFTPEMFRSFRNGMEHSIPITSSIKVLKYFNMSNTISYKERWYTKSLLRTWVNDTLWTNDTTYDVGYIRNDTLSGFKTARDFGFTSSLSTTLYGMVQMKRGPVRAIRHVIKPNVSFSLRPDFGSPTFGYYRTVQSDTLGNFSRYSIFGDGTNFSSIYGSPPDGKSGSVGFSLTNNLEMKVRSKSDTVTGMKKVMLIESFSIGTSYDLAKDSLNWSTVSLSARTTLFKKLQISYTSRWDPYVINEDGVTLNQFEWDVNHRLLRKDNTTWNFSFDYNFSSGDKKKTPKAESEEARNEQEEFARNPENYINWNNPWSFSLRYNLNYIGQNLPSNGQTKSTVNQTIGFSGDVSITPKWKVSFTSGYDLKLNKLAYNTSVNIYRDLHCWEMRLNWIPIGTYKSWNFYIKVKASVLQDLKLTKKKDFRDN